MKLTFEALAGSGLAVLSALQHAWLPKTAADGLASLYVLIR